MTGTVTLPQLAQRILDVVDTLNAPNPDLTTATATLEWVAVNMLAIAQQAQHDAPART